MKPNLTAIIGLKSSPLGSNSQALKPRTTYPILSVVPLHRSPLRKLAWIFGFRR